MKSEREREEGEKPVKGLAGSSSFTSVCSLYIVSKRKVQDTTVVLYTSAYSIAVQRMLHYIIKFTISLSLSSAWSDDAKSEKKLNTQTDTRHP
jgi:hypothetical protein